MQNKEPPRALTPAIYTSSKANCLQIPLTLRGADAATLRAYLDSISKTVRETLRGYYQEQLEALANQNLHVTHAFQSLFKFCRLIDSFHQFAFAVATNELPALARLRKLETIEEQTRKKQQIPLKEQQFAQLTEEVAKQEENTEVNTGENGEGNSEEDQTDSAQLEYYRGLARAMGESVQALKKSVENLEEIRLDIASWNTEHRSPDTLLVLFARGGYGRAEMSFSSDVDTGYCLDTREMGTGEVAIYQDMVMRIEALLNDAGLSTVHQYFELEEDLSRFTETEALHTFPAILEARPLIGDAELLNALKRRFKALLPFEEVVRQKSENFSRQSLTGMTTMDLKEDTGGLRSIQIPLWLLGITYNASSFMTMDLLQLARRKDLLSMWEVSHLLQAVEFLYELRNFTGAAERYYYDREARESGFLVHAFIPNRLDDQLTRLYLFRKQRFSSLDAFDSFRLRLVTEVQRITEKLMFRVLNRTITHSLETLRVEVHLGEKQIIAINSAKNSGSADIPSLFRTPSSVLELFGYLAESDFDLSTTLKDDLTAVVMGMQFEENDRASLGGLLNNLMLGPYAHRAMRTLLEVNDPLMPGMPTLLGRFIPPVDRMLYLVRRFDGRTMSLHEHALKSLEQGQYALESLRKEHHDLFHLLAPDDVLAMKWALFFHDIARIENVDAEPSQSAEKAAEILAVLGFRESAHEEKLRLLISHHRSLAALSRLATYMDQAIAQYFEISGRNMVNAVLLYLVNLAIVRARGEEALGDVAQLQTVFEEANQIWGEMHGFPVKERSLEVINIYFERKKGELYSETRLFMLYHESMAQGLKPVIFDPLEANSPSVWKRVSKATSTLDELHKEIRLGSLERDAQGRMEIKMVQTLRNQLGMEAVFDLTNHHQPLLEWFFASFPNRYLNSALPTDLARQVVKFANFRTMPVIVDLVAGANGANQGLLIYTQGLELSHSRVAFALSRLQLNITSGKVNRVDLGDTAHSFCYFFQFTPLETGDPLRARDVEEMITGEAPPEMNLPPRSKTPPAKKARVDFMGNDGKGYLIRQGEKGYQRDMADFSHQKLVFRDEPFLFYKLMRVFDHYGVEVQQALITTTGGQVVDYLYFETADYERLQKSDFEERLIDLVNTDLMALIR